MWVSIGANQVRVKVQEVVIPYRGSILSHTLVHMRGIFRVPTTRTSWILLLSPENQSGANPAIRGCMFGNITVLCRRKLVHHCMGAVPINIVTCRWGKQTVASPPLLRWGILHYGIKSVCRWIRNLLRSLPYLPPLASNIATGRKGI